MLRFNFRIRVKPRRRKCARRCEKIPRHPVPMATTPLGCQESAPLKRSCPVMARPNQLSQSILPRGEKIGLASNLPFEGRDMKKAQRKVILYDAKDAREIPTSTLLDQLGVKRDKRGKVKCPLTCPRFCTTASERVYITARGCETGLGSPGGYRPPVPAACSPEPSAAVLHWTPIAIFQKLSARWRGHLACGPQGGEWAPGGSANCDRPNESASTSPERFIYSSR